jgi:dinuclear metal center YbgI/SA1388 family protein
MVTVANVVDYLSEFAPFELAAAWDNVGLLLGDPAAEVRGVMTCLTLTPESAAEAVESAAQLVVPHHPILFRPVQRLTSATPDGRMLLTLARAGVAVSSPHTAFDNTRSGINEILGQRLGLTEVLPLRAAAGMAQYKVVVFVPDADLARVCDSMFAAGAGHIGQYSQCSFRLAGTGTFFGSEASNPTIGQKGRREEASEWRLEVLCPEAAVGQVVSALRGAHSYEEPAYDVYPLRPSPSALGEGRVGRLPQRVRLRELAAITKTRLRAGLVQVVGDPDRYVERVAIACGAGGSLLEDAVRVRADALLTGEARFHDFLAAQAHGLALVLPGHYASERWGVEELAEILKRQWPGLNIWPSTRERDPVTLVL